MLGGDENLKLDKKELLKFLIANSNVTLDNLKKQFDKPISLLRNEVEEINNQFSNDVILMDETEIYISEKAKTEIYKRFFDVEDRIFTFIDVDQRCSLIYILFTTSKYFLSLQEIADLCLVSKNTILNDLKVLKKKFEESGLSVKYERKIGYSIEGSEFIIRNKLAECIKRILKVSGGGILLDETNLINENEIFMYRKRLEAVEKRIGITLTDEQHYELPYILYLIIKRAYKLDHNWTFKVERYDIKNTAEYPEITQMFWDCPELDETDLVYLSLQIISSNMVESALQISDSDEISLATEEFIENISNYLAISVGKKYELKEKIILHVRPAIYRNLLGFQIKNPLTERFIKEYEEIFNVVLKSVSPFEKIIHHKLSKEEIVYLSMIVLSWIYQSEVSNPVFKAAILCQNGTSVSKLLLTTLKSMFSDIEFVGAFSIRQFEQLKKEVEIDFIFTTIPIESDIKTFLISPIINKQERINLKEEVSRQIKNDSNQITKGVLSAIKDYIPSNQLKAASESIESFFRETSPVATKETNKMNNSTEFAFSIDNIKLVNARVKWNEIVEYSMNPLFQRGSITQEYINETDKSFKKYFDKMVIGPNVYLPHASAKFGAKRMDFQILVFKNPTKTPTNEDIHIVVALSPDIDNKHVPTLIKLNNLFLDEKTLSRIKGSNSIFEIKKILTS